MNDKARYGKRIFTHYITMVMRANGLQVDSDTQAEIEMAIDDIIEAAVSEAVARLAEIEPANPHDADSPGHPCGYGVTR